MNDSTTQQREDYRRANEVTATNLRRLMSETLDDHHTLSLLSVPERDELIEQVAQILPAGNVTRFILNGILSVQHRDAAPDAGRMHFSSLLKALAVVRNNAFYSMMFAGPATVLAGYNMLLRLAGARWDDFLPEGAWQFYVEFGLREDAARHQSETTRFQAVAQQIHPALSEAQKLSAWMLAAMWLLRDYHHLLTNLWEEHIRLKTIEETTGLERLHRAWQKLIPYNVPPGHDSQSITLYRRRRFEEFCSDKLSQVGPEQRSNFERTWSHPSNVAERRGALHAYHEQLSIRSFLEPGEYSERRVAILGKDLQISIVHRGQYFLIPFSDPSNPLTPMMMQQRAQRILDWKGPVRTGLDLLLVRTSRADQTNMRQRLPNEQAAAIQMLHRAPIILNWDEAPAQQPLTVIRERHRGVGDHALTLFRTNTSTVFDFSHIYFDGPWALAVAEMMTNVAAGCLQNSMSGRATQGPGQAITLDLSIPAGLRPTGKNRSRAVNYISAEAQMRLAPLSDLRRLLTSRTKPPVDLTINDLMVLYRTLFNQIYQPGPELTRTLHQLSPELSLIVWDELRSKSESRPSLLIPIDASAFNPRDRLFPSVFRSPFPDLLADHRHTFDLLSSKERDSGEFETFQQARAAYLSTLSAFSQVMRRYHEIAVKGESMSTTAIELIAGLPEAMKRIVDGIPGHFAFVNEAIKGEEVFSNVGQVAPGSSLSRFASAKDDNDKKVLVWGVMTNNDNRLTITLRDFRPHVAELVQAGHGGVAQLIAQDFLNGYLHGLKAFASELRAIVEAPKA